jgi:hypothetical protein
VWNNGTYGEATLEEDGGISVEFNVSGTEESNNAGKSGSIEVKFYNVDGNLQGDDATRPYVKLVSEEEIVVVERFPDEPILNSTDGQWVKSGNLSVYNPIGILMLSRTEAPMGEESEQPDLPEGFEVGDVVKFTFKMQANVENQYYVVAPDQEKKEYVQGDLRVFLDDTSSIKVEKIIQMFDFNGIQSNKIEDAWAWIPTNLDD